MSSGPALAATARPVSRTQPVAAVTSSLKVERPNGFRGPRSPILMAGEGRAWWEAGSLLRDPVWRGDGVPDGDGRPVLLIPGFLSGDGSTVLLLQCLRSRWYWSRS